MARFIEQKFIAANEMNPPFEKQGSPDLVCFDGSGYVIRDLTPASDTQLIRVEAWYQDFSGWESKWGGGRKSVPVEGDAFGLFAPIGVEDADAAAGKVLQL